MAGFQCSMLIGQPLNPLLQNQSLIQSNQDGTLQIGLVRLDPKTQTITFPVEINMREGQLEYALTGPLGKLHESLLKTETSPVHIHLAVLLAGIEKMETQPTHSENEIQKPISITLHWIKNKEHTDKPLEALILNQETGLSIGQKSWNYTGAQFIDRQFTVHREQSYIAIIEDIDALVNSNDPNRKNDDIWSANTKLLPKIGTHATLSVKVIQTKESNTLEQENSTELN